MLLPSTTEVSTAMWDMEEDPKDMIPLSHRTRVARAAVGKRAISRVTPPPMIEENLIELEEPAEVKVHEEQHLEKDPGHDELHVGRIDFMPVGATMEGGRIVDPRFFPLPKGPLGMPTLPSPTP